MTSTRNELAEAEEKVRLGLALHRLSQNSDFKKIILNEFCKQEVTRQVRLASGATDEITRNYHHRVAESGAHLEAFLRSVQFEADAARENIKTLQQLEEEAD